MVNRRGGRQRERERRAHKLAEDGKQLSEEVSLEAASFPHKRPSLSLATVRACVAQLGYQPYNLVDAVVETSEGSVVDPLVAILYPLNANDVGGRYAKEGGRKPFPTTLWIVSRDLYSRISKLEDLGWVQKLQRRLTHGHEDGPSSSAGSGAGDPTQAAAWQQSMRLAHQRYAAFRWSLLTPEDAVWVESKGWRGALQDVGVAGIRDFMSVKCLHGHYAHHRARPEDGNVVGEWVATLLARLRSAADGALVLVDEGVTPDAMPSTSPPQSSSAAACDAAPPLPAADDRQPQEEQRKEDKQQQEQGEEPRAAAVPQRATTSYDVAPTSSFLCLRTNHPNPETTTPPAGRSCAIS